MSTQFLDDEQEAIRYVPLVEAVIKLAMDDYIALTGMSAIKRDGTVNDFFWSARAKGGHRCPKNLQSPVDAHYLQLFLRGTTLDFLCEHLPKSSDFAFPCRIRKHLGITTEV